GAANGYGRAAAVPEAGRAAAVPEAGRPTRPVPSPAPRRGLPPRTVRPPAGTPRRAPRTHPRPRAVVGAPVAGTRRVMQHTGAPGPAHDHSASVYYSTLDIEISTEAHCTRRGGKDYLTS